MRVETCAGNRAGNLRCGVTMTDREIERILAEEADEAKVWEAIEEYLKGVNNGET